jgi:hypothetical protein
MNGAVVSRAERREVFGIVAAAFDLGIDVMDVHENGMATAGNHALPAVAPQHVSTTGGWNGLRRSRLRAHVGVAEVLRVARELSTHVGIGEVLRVARELSTHVGIGMTNVLRIARCHFDDFVDDIEELAAPLLAAATALLADRERHLVARAAVVARAAEDVASHQEHGRIVVERLASLTTELCERFPEGRERFGRKLESQDVATCGWVHRIPWRIARSMP